MFITSSIFLDFILGICTTFFFIYKIITWNFDYWRKRGVPYVEPKFPLGTLKINLLGKKSHYGLLDKEIYDAFKNEKYVGTFAMANPQLFIIDLDIVKQVLTKDFSHFVDRGMFAYVKADFCAHHMFNMEGEAWKRMRTRLSPTFTSGRLKGMIELMFKVTEQLKTHLEPLAEQNAEVDIRDVVSRTTIDMIATTAFGLDVNTLKNPDNIMRKVAAMSSRTTLVSFMRQFTQQYIHFLAKTFNILQIQPVVSSFCKNLLKDTMEHRKTHGVKRNDFIDLLIGVKNKSKSSERDVEDSNEDAELTLEVMTAQVFAFFSAGFDTVASALTFLIFELAQNKEVQDKLRQEVDDVYMENNGTLNYDCLKGFPYMEMVINESLRRYAPVPYLRRRCTKTFTFPETGLTLEKGTMVTIPAYAIHHDPDIYPDPYKFDPERFSEENVSKRHPYAHLPFGEGPRNCIGKRFGLMEVKLAVATLVRHFEISPSPRLPSMLPVDNKRILTISEIPIYCIVSKRTQL